MGLARVQSSASLRPVAILCRPRLITIPDDYTGGNPAPPGGSLQSKPTWLSTLVFEHVGFVLGAPESGVARESSTEGVLFVGDSLRNLYSQELECFYMALEALQHGVSRMATSDGAEFQLGVERYVGQMFDLGLRLDRLFCLVHDGPLRIAEHGAHGVNGHFDERRTRTQETLGGTGIAKVTRMVIAGQSAGPVVARVSIL